MSFRLILNGQSREFADIAPPVTLDQAIASLGLKADRVAVEHNGAIVPRAQWQTTELTQDDRLEVVHFVGGGCGGYLRV